MDDTPPERRLADRYVLQARIATGGMASVWRAEDEVLARPVAVKVLHEDLARDPGFLERFRQEAVAAARLSHPRIVRVYDTGTEGDICFIVMELFEGEDLGAALRRGPMEPARAAWVISCALEGLGYAHEQGIVHRDVKPGNILVGAGDAVRVTDFGVAKAILDERDLTTTGRVLGTVRYLSPEQVQGKPADPRSDLYSAGVVLYEALAGRPPFEAETDLATATMRLTRDPMPPRAVRAGIPRGLEKVTLQALARDPAARFATADEMRLAIGRALGETTGEMRPVVVHPNPVRRDDAPDRAGASVFRSWMLVPLVMLALAAALVVGGLLLGRLEPGGVFGVRPKHTVSATTALPVGAAEDFDPQGDDGHENPDEAGFAIDGDPGTAWETVRYDSAGFGGLKDGVGLILDLGGQATVLRVVLESPISGWTFQVRVADDRAHALDAAADRPDEAGAHVFTVTNGRADVSLKPFKARFVLIWISQLAPSDAGGYRASIAGVHVFGTHD